MIDWVQISYGLITACVGLLCGIVVYYMRRVDRHDELLIGLAVINALLQKHEVRLDAIDLSITHIREFAHETRNLLPSAFEKQEIDRRRSETHANFMKIFACLDEMKNERFKYHQEIMNLLHTKQDKPR